MRTRDVRGGAFSSRTGRGILFFCGAGRAPHVGTLQRESFWFKLLPVTGTSWILVYFSILDNFALWVGSEKYLENGVHFFGSECKIQGKINTKICFDHNF